MEYNSLPQNKSIQKTMEALKKRGIESVFVKNRKEALEKIIKLIPKGREVMTGSSVTLEEIGFVNLLKSKKHPWRNLKDEILAEKDPGKQAELRKKSVLSEYFLGSVHGISQTGEVVIASASGSQLPSYVFTSENVIWVSGAQKIVPSLEEAIKRVREYVFDLEDKRMKSLGAQGSTIGKLVIFEREIMPRKIIMILVGEKLGF